MAGTGATGPNPGHTRRAGVEDTDRTRRSGIRNAAGRGSR